MTTNSNANDCKLPDVISWRPTANQKKTFFELQVKTKKKRPELMRELFDYALAERAQTEGTVRDVAVKLEAMKYEMETKLEDLEVLIGRNSGELKTLMLFTTEAVTFVKFLCHRTDPAGFEAVTARLAALAKQKESSSKGADSERKRT